MHTDKLLARDVCTVVLLIVSSWPHRLAILSNVSLVRMSFGFELHHIDGCRDRVRVAALFDTPHGRVETPGFMPVGTQGTVKGLTIDHVAATGAHMILGNTYHLGLRPGHEVVRALGGLHAMCGWEGPILTDSGGFQVFSLQGASTRSTEHSVVVPQSHRWSAGRPDSRALDRDSGVAWGATWRWCWITSLRCQPNAMKIELAMERSIRWAKRCLEYAGRADQAKVRDRSGGTGRPVACAVCDASCRRWISKDYAVGGLSVGETPDEMYRITAATTPELAAEKPRYLMGVGRPIDLLESVVRGIDLFDCVMPTRNGRNGFAFTDSGPIKIRNAKHQNRHVAAG